MIDEIAFTEPVDFDTRLVPRPLLISKSGQ